MALLGIWRQVLRVDIYKFKCTPPYVFGLSPEMLMSRTFESVGTSTQCACFTLKERHSSPLLVQTPPGANPEFE